MTVEDGLKRRSPVVLEAHAVSKVFRHSGGDVQALNRVKLQVRASEAVAVMGRSGAGKSTLLHVLGGLEAPSEGRVIVEGRDLYGLGDRDRAALRAARMSFVFQAHHLLSEFTALENVLLPARILGCPESKARERARDLLETFGLADRTGHRPVELSGGECQRVALARALVNRPAIVLADEPTGNLDREHAEDILVELSRVVEHDGGALVIVTHDPGITEIAHRVVRLDDGRING